MKKKILIVSRHETSFQELYKLYEQINLNEFDVKFFFASQEKIKIKKDSFYDISNDVYNKTLVKCLIKFEKYLIDLDCDDSWVEEKIIEAVNALNAEEMPKGSKGCDTCQYLKKRWQVSQSLSTN